MNGEEYIPVDVAREQLGVSPREMLMLLEAEALRYRKDSYNETVKWVYAEDVREAVEHLARYRQEEEERRRRLISIPENANESEAKESSFFTFSDTDLMTLLLASVSYFDAERDIYFRAFDERSNIGRTITAISKIYGKLEQEIKAGRSISEVVMEIYEQQPSIDSRNAVFSYLMNKVRQNRKQI
jgi:hypothetical protein